MKFKNTRVTKLYFLLKLLLRLSSAGVGVAFLLLFLRGGKTDYLLKMLQCAAFFALSFLPKLVHFEGTPGAAFFYFFLLFAGLGGSVFALFERIPFLDNLTHFLSGLLCVVIFADVLKRTGLQLGKGTAAAGALTFTLAVACAWEMYEFLVFGILPHSAFSLRSLAAEFGAVSAKTAAASAMKENLVLNFGTIEGLLKNEYDTFCDILCALIGAATAQIRIYRR